MDGDKRNLPSVVTLGETRGVNEANSFSVFGQFSSECAKVAMIHMKFSQIWLQDKFESRILRTSFNTLWLYT